MNVRKIAKRIAYWTVPPGFQQVGQVVCRSLVRRPSGLSLEERTILSRNAKFNNMYAGRRCFVIGNGPSLNKQNLTPLANEVTIAMNWFNRHPIIDVWKPTLFCVAEPGNMIRNEKLQLELENIQAQAYFFRIDARHHFDRFSFVDQDKLYFLKMEGSPTKDTVLDLTKPIPGAPDTSIMATMIALTLGCSPIYLLGLDYDWLSHRSLHRHFYDADDPVQTREDLSSYSYLQLMRMSIGPWSAHDALREIGLRRGQQIFNATNGSFLDAYPMVSLAEVLASDHKILGR